MKIDGRINEAYNRQNVTAYLKTTMVPIGAYPMKLSE